MLFVSSLRFSREDTEASEGLGSLRCAPVIPTTTASLPGPDRDGREVAACSCWPVGCSYSSHPPAPPPQLLFRSLVSPGRRHGSLHGAVETGGCSGEGRTEDRHTMLFSRPSRSVRPSVSSGSVVKLTKCLPLFWRTFLPFWTPKCISSSYVIKEKKGEHREDTEV